MRIVHTSDWHLGCSLQGQKRYEEHDAFLAWLLELLSDRAVDVLLIAGDVFDSTVPTNRALKQYYQFLHQVSQTCCRQVIITGGNHDSPSLLAAPRELLRYLNIHVIPAIEESLEQEIIACTSTSGAAEAHVLAVPYLRERDIRSAQAGESLDDKSRKLIEGVIGHYHDLCTLAEKKRQGRDLPLIAMGHLFTAGALINTEDGERDLYIGSLAHIPIERLPAQVDYYALGHLHRAQDISTARPVHYSGSPLPMSFAGSRSAQSVSLLNCPGGRAVQQERVEIPRSKELFSIVGDLPEILNRLAELRADDRPAWVEIEYTGEPSMATLQRQVLEASEGTSLDIVRIRNKRLMERTMGLIDEREALDDLEPEEVFRRCLLSHQVPEDQHAALLTVFRIALQEMVEEDERAQ